MESNIVLSKERKEKWELVKGVSLLETGYRIGLVEGRRLKEATA